MFGQAHHPFPYSLAQLREWGINPQKATPPAVEDSILFEAIRKKMVSTQFDSSAGVLRQFEPFCIDSSDGKPPRFLYHFIEYDLTKAYFKAYRNAPQTNYRVVFIPAMLIHPEEYENEEGEIEEYLVADVKGRDGIATIKTSWDDCYPRFDCFVPLPVFWRAFRYALQNEVKPWDTSHARTRVSCSEKKKEEPEAEERNEARK